MQHSDPKILGSSVPKVFCHKILRIVRHPTVILFSDCLWHRLASPLEPMLRHVTTLEKPLKEHRNLLDRAYRGYKFILSKIYFLLILGVPGTDWGVSTLNSTTVSLN